MSFCSYCLDYQGLCACILRFYYFFVFYIYFDYIISLFFSSLQTHPYYSFALFKFIPIFLCCYMCICICVYIYVPKSIKTTCLVKYIYFFWGLAIWFWISNWWVHPWGRLFHLSPFLTWLRFCLSPQGPSPIHFWHTCFDNFVNVTVWAIMSGRLYGYSFWYC